MREKQIICRILINENNINNTINKLNIQIDMQTHQIICEAKITYIFCLTIDNNLSVIYTLCMILTMIRFNVIYSQIIIVNIYIIARFKVG